MDRGRRSKKGKYAAIGDEDSPRYVQSLGEDILGERGNGEPLEGAVATPGEPDPRREKVVNCAPNAPEAERGGRDNTVAPKLVIPVRAQRRICDHRQCGKLRQCQFWEEFHPDDAKKPW